MSVEDYTDEVVHAFCEYGGCSPKCREDEWWGCRSVSQSENDDDEILL